MYNIAEFFVPPKSEKQETKMAGDLNVQSAAVRAERLSALDARLRRITTIKTKDGYLLERDAIMSEFKSLTQEFDKEKAEILALVEEFAKKSAEVSDQLCLLDSKNPDELEATATRMEADGHHDLAKILRRQAQELRQK